MISLREKLKMVKAGSSETKKPAEPQKAPLFMEENRVPAAVLTGVDRITLEEIRACEPTFTGTQWNLSDLLFLDTETTGLSGGAGTLAFEIGVGYFEQDSFMIRQYVIRDYPQEREMLEAIIALAKEHSTMVTFNGKTFDLPLIESRWLCCTSAGGYSSSVWAAVIWPRWKPRSLGRSGRMISRVPRCRSAFLIT